jgi:3-hydroxybutyryl-CoA dehydrogenase
MTHMTLPPQADLSSAIHSIGIIGAGQMGSGIAQVAAMSGFQVRLLDVGDEAIQRYRSRIFPDSWSTGFYCR